MDTVRLTRTSPPSFTSRWNCRTPKSYAGAAPSCSVATQAVLSGSAPLPALALIGHWN